MPKKERKARQPQMPSTDSRPGDLPEGLPEIHLDAVAPAPVAKFKLGKRSFAVRSIMDVAAGELQAMLDEQERLRQKTATWREQIALARKQILLLIPELTDADLDGLTARQIATLSGRLFAGLGLPRGGKEYHGTR